MNITQTKKELSMTSLVYLFTIICAVESGHNPAAVGDFGQSVGIAQIQSCVIEDVNQFVGYKKYYLADRTDPDKSREIFVLYLNRWGRNYTKNTGKQPTLEVYSRMWNGGPKGYRKRATDPYWKKVRSRIPPKKLI